MSSGATGKGKGTNRVDDGGRSRLPVVCHGNLLVAVFAGVSGSERLGGGVNKAQTQRMG